MKLSGGFRVGDSTTVHQSRGSKRYTAKEISQLAKKIKTVTEGS